MSFKIPLIHSFACIVFAALCCVATAADATSERVEKIEVFPDAIVLNTVRARVQVIVLGYASNGHCVDLTREAILSLSDEKIAVVESGVVLPNGNGATNLTVKAGGQMKTVPVTVALKSAIEPISFRNEVLAALTKQGCNAGSCHGKPNGRGALELSLNAFDPIADVRNLTRGNFSRFINPVDPGESLILKKPLLKIAHVGGKKLSTTDAAYGVLSNWISEGARSDVGKVAECSSVEVTPHSGHVLHFPRATQQLRVSAHFVNGTIRDVTDIAAYSTSDEKVATVDERGLVTGQDRGHVAIVVRYLDFIVSTSFTLVKDVPGFEWKKVDEQNYVDVKTNTMLRQLQFPAAEICSDSVFLRRVYLDVTGLIPPADEARAFLADSSRDKRAKLIDKLLASPAYAKFWALKTADLLRVNAMVLSKQDAEAYNRWIEKSIASNTPFDVFVRDLLTASGPTDSVPQANYFRTAADSVTVAESTAQVFMGSRLQCAKCHNHPYESWTQDNYYQIASAFHGVERKGLDKPENKDAKVRIEIRSGMLMSNPRTKVVQKPWPVDAAAKDVADPRVRFAEWLTAPSNPYFARVAVNRIWANVMGVGIVEPVDDFRSSNPPSNPELLDALAADFADHKFDRKHLLRTILNSQTYQRRSETNALNASDDRFFSHYKVRMLSAEQLQDAMTRVATVAPDSVQEIKELDELRDKFEKTVHEIAPAMEPWAEKLADAMNHGAVVRGAWLAAGPLKIKSADEVLKQNFAPEAGFDRNKRYEDNSIGWLDRPDLDDGVVNTLGKNPRSTHFLYRKLTAQMAEPIVLSVGSTDAIKVWINGREVFANDVKRKVAPNQDKISGDLKAGDNTILIGLASKSNDPTAFYFAIQSPESFSDAVADAVRLPAEKRTPAQQALLLDRFQASHPEIMTLKTQIDLKERAMSKSYMTQQAVPQQSEFLVSFGQPKRESACTCERRDDVGLLQVVKLMNSALVNDMLQHASTRFKAPTRDAKSLVEDIYFAALSRPPTDVEAKAATEFLSKKKSPGDGAADLTWALFNSNEFIFQH